MTTNVNGLLNEVFLLCKAPTCVFNQIMIHPVGPLCTVHIPSVYSCLSSGKEKIFFALLLSCGTSEAVSLPVQTCMGHMSGIMEMETARFCVQALSLLMCILWVLINTRVPVKHLKHTH